MMQSLFWFFKWCASKRLDLLLYCIWWVWSILSSALFFWWEVYEIRWPHRVALAASQITAGHTREFLLSDQFCDKLLRTKLQKDSLLKKKYYYVINLQIGVLGILNAGSICKWTGEWSERTIESMRQVWTALKKFWEWRDKQDGNMNYEDVNKMYSRWH